MPRASAFLVLLAGVGLGTLVHFAGFSSPRDAKAGSVDRFGDFVMCTGACSINPRLQTDGVWLLDYRSGKLLGTVIDRSQGKTVGWAEVDLAAEFDVQPKTDVHFMMCTGYLTQTTSALYVAETTTGKFGVYTMGPAPGGNGIVINRHQISSFRNVQPAVQPATATIPGMPGVSAVPVTGQPFPAQPGGVPTPSMLPPVNPHAIPTPSTLPPVIPNVPPAPITMPPVGNGIPIPNPGK